LRVLLVGHRYARRAGGAFALCSPQHQVMRIISLVGFDQVFAIYASQEQALQAVSVPARSSATVKETT